jgi:hypothetical protein
MSDIYLRPSGDFSANGALNGTIIAYDERGEPLWESNGIWSRRAFVRKQASDFAETLEIPLERAKSLLNSALKQARKQGDMVKAQEENTPVVGEDCRTRKRNMADRALKYIEEKKAEVFHDQHSDAFIAYLNKENRLEVWPIRSEAAKEYISMVFFEVEEKGLTSEAIATVRLTLSARARFQGQRQTLNLRVARTDDARWYDLGSGDFRAIRITTEGWEIIHQPPILFRRYLHQVSQVEPRQGGSIDRLLDLVNIRNPDHRLLLKVYLVAALLSDIALPILIITGEKGSAKTTTHKLLRKLIDPSSLETLTAPNNIREFIQLAAHHRTVYLDNVSSFPDWQSDAFCRLCTGEGFSKRQLFTDDDDIVYNFRGLGGLNGINLVAANPDLLARSIMLRQEPISEEERRGESEILEEFERKRPFILGTMFDALSKAMSTYRTVNLSHSPRLADFAHWGAAIAQALGHSAEEFIEAYERNIKSHNEEAVNESMVAYAILEFMTNEKCWQGFGSQLWKTLEAQADNLSINTKDKDWPKSASWFSHRLREVVPDLRAMGIECQERMPHGKIHWTLVLQLSENAPPVLPSPLNSDNMGA